MPRSKEKQAKHEKAMLRKLIAKKTKSKLRKRVFAGHLLNIEDEKTYCNYTQAALKTHPAIKPITAAGLGSKLANDSYVQNQIEYTLEQMGLGVENRVRVLRDIVLGDIERHTTQQVRDNETGEWLATHRQVSKPSFKERTDAIRILNQLDGTDEKSKAIAKTQTKLFSEMRKKLMQSLEDGRHDVLKQVVDKSLNYDKRLIDEDVSGQLEQFTDSLKRENKDLE